MKMLDKDRNFTQISTPRAIANQKLISLYQPVGMLPDMLELYNDL